MTTSSCTFIRLIGEEDKGAALPDSINALRNGEESPTLFSTIPSNFSKIPGSPFAYWVSERIRQLFVNLPSFEGANRTSKQGLATADDFQFVRAWWEVESSKIVHGKHDTTHSKFKDMTYSGKQWIPFAKGGAYSPYYTDIHLIVNWGYNGKKIKNRINPDSNRPYSNVWMLKDTEENYFFRSGLTWSLRTQLGFNIRQFPTGSIFGHKGPVSFIKNINLPSSLGLMNSTTFSQLISLQMAFGSYEVGVIQKTPLPYIKNEKNNQLTSCVYKILQIKRDIDKINEISHTFMYPSVILCQNENINEITKNWQHFIKNSIVEGDIIQNQIDEISFDVYGISDPDRDTIRQEFSDRPSPVNAPPTDSDSVVTDFLSYAFGCILGRWDIRYATGEKQPPELPDPFAPLPPCSPGMLQGEDGLPLEPHEIPSDYPLLVDADGILVDDEGHSDDIIARMRDVLSLIWGDRADAIETEACEILGVRSLRDYFRKPGAGGFWNDHVKRYSKSRRKAPIYWLLQSAKKNYGIWIYYPRMDGDTLYKALRYAKDKRSMEVRRLEEMTARREESGTGGAAVKRLEKEIERQEAFVSELHEFVEKLERAANLNLIPEHDDGVVLTIAPLWEIVPWKEPKKYWDELIGGKYEWSSIGKQLTEKGMVTRR